MAVANEDVVTSLVRDANHLWWPIGTEIVCCIAVLALKMNYPNPKDRKFKLPIGGIDVPARYVSSPELQASE
jgi:hypothetical protein